MLPGGQVMFAVVIVVDFSLLAGFALVVNFVLVDVALVVADYG